MENEKLTYINSRGERLELGVDSVYHCTISKDVEGISGVTSVIYSTNSMGQHGDTYVGQRIEARDIDVVGHINTRDNTYSAAVMDEFSAYKQNMEKYLAEIAGVYDSYVSKTEGLFAQYESQFNERYSSFESTLDNWDKELLSAYTEFMAKIKLFQSDAENEFNTWFESIKDKLG